jgi:hypothetical protein
MDVKVVVDVDEDVYNGVVVPFKEKHKFSKLVGRLLDAYYENDSIKEYVDTSIGFEDDLLEQSLFDELNKMKESLDRLDGIKDKVKEVSEDGMEFFDSGEKATLGVSEKFIKDEISDLKQYIKDLIKNNDVECYTDFVEVVDEVIILEEYTNMVETGGVYEV